MNTREATTLDCRKMEADLPALLPDLLFDPAAVPLAAREHLSACDPCRAVVDSELAAHGATVQLLDAWEAPPLSPYFESRMTALLREEQRHPRAGFFAGMIDRAQSWLLLTNLQLKPIAGAAALGVVLAVGGGAYIDLSQHQAAAAPQASATVRDLQSLDENAQVFQQMNTLDAGDGDAPSGSSL